MSENSTINSSIVERLKKLRKQYQLTQAQLANHIGVTQSIVSVVEGEKSAVSLEFLRKAAAYYNVSIEWLLYGKERFTELKLGNFVPLVDYGVKADYLIKSEEPEFLETLGMYRIPGYEKGDYLIFAVEGDSMEPSVQDGDKLICSPLTEAHTLTEGSISVVVTQNDIVVKRVFYNREKPDFYILKSDNSLYHPVTIAKGDVRKLWKVEAKITNAFVKDTPHKFNRLEKLEKELELVKQKLNKIIATSGDLAV